MYWPSNVNCSMRPISYNTNKTFISPFRRNNDQKLTTHSLGANTEGRTLKTDNLNSSVFPKNDKTFACCATLRLRSRHSARTNVIFTSYVIRQMQQTSKYLWVRILKTRTDMSRQTPKKSSEPYFTIQWCACRLLLNNHTTNYWLKTENESSKVFKIVKSWFSSVTRWRGFADGHVPVFLISLLFSDFFY